MSHNISNAPPVVPANASMVDMSPEQAVEQSNISATALVEEMNQAASANASVPASIPAIAPAIAPATTPTAPVKKNLAFVLVPSGGTRGKGTVKEKDGSHELRPIEDSDWGASEEKRKEAKDRMQRRWGAKKEVSVDYPGIEQVYKGELSTQPNAIY